MTDSTMTGQQEAAHDALCALWQNPDVVCESEYRAIYECAVEGTEDIEDPRERHAMQLAILTQIIEHAQAMLTTLGDELTSPYPNTSKEAP